MADPTETRAALLRLNRASAERFDIVATRVGERMSPEVLATWCSQVRAIAGSGWHAFESANAYVEVTEALIERAGDDAVVDVGRFGLALSGFSYEPSATWFRGVAGLLAADRLDRLPAVEAICTEIRGRFPHASTLIGDFLRAAFSIAATESAAALASWSEAARSMADDRARLIAFLKATEAGAGISWPFIDSLQARSSTAALSFLEAWPAFADAAREPRFDRAAFERLALAYADAGLDDWLSALGEQLPTLGSRERATLWAVMDALPSPDLALALLSSLDQLPMGRRDVIEAWAEGARKFIPLQPEAARGYLALESAASESSLEHLQGQVNLIDVKRLLQLFSEAVTGTRLAIEPAPLESGHFRDLPSTDGLTIRLPEVIRQYRDSASNFALYKVCLLHQLGYYEFGTFEFGVDGSRLSFREHFRRYDDPALAEYLFQILEDARIDWRLERHYRGIAPLLARFKADARAAIEQAPVSSVRGLYLLALLGFSLDGQALAAGDEFAEDIELLRRSILQLTDIDADVNDTMMALDECYAIIDAASGAAPPQTSTAPAPADADAERSDKEAPEPVAYRGKLEPDRARLNQQLAELDEQDVETGDGEEQMLPMTGEVDPKDLRIEQLRKGDVQQAIGMMIADIDAADIEEGESGDDELEPFRGLINDTPRDPDDQTFQYDEWDCVIEDYRRRWCTLVETRRFDEKPEYVMDAVRELKTVARNVRRQLSQLRPELLRKVKGVEHGEDLDLEKTIDAIIDRRAGRSPEERIYVQRLRKDRDVSALFLLDMSASTDDRVPATEPEPAREPPPFDADDFLHDYYGQIQQAERGKRIIDVEKEAVILMAEALEELGDSYSICGFSGYGRNQVDFYLAKDFTEAYNQRVKGRIGGIKPCRSTRMGPAIRHAAKRLSATESRTKALIIISDGYPQDFDYGRDRNSKDYGIRDTTMALTEARRQGIQTFCLTVDPSGHDYLREMCPDQQYMVIQQIEQLPDELSKVYRSLTA